MHNTTAIGTDHSEDNKHKQHINLHSKSTDEFLVNMKKVKLHNKLLSKHAFTEIKTVTSRCRIEKTETSVYTTATMAMYVPEMMNFAKY